MTEEKYIRKINCIMKDCSGIVSVHWDNENGFKNATCPICKTSFETYIETRLRLIKTKDSPRKIK